MNDWLLKTYAYMDVCYLNWAEINTVYELNKHVTLKGLISVFKWKILSSYTRGHS